MIKSETTERNVYKGSYLIIEFVGEMEDEDGNYNLFYEADSEPFATVNWLNFAGHGIATRDSMEINQKSRVEVTHNGAGGYIKSEMDE